MVDDSVPTTPSLRPPTQTNMVDDSLSTCATRVASHQVLSEPHHFGVTGKSATLDLSSLQEKLKMLQARPAVSTQKEAAPALDSDTDAYTNTDCDSDTNEQPEPPPSPETAVTEEQLLLLSRTGDVDGAVRVVEAAAAAGKLNARMVNMSLSAMLGAGRHPDGATSWMLTTCQACHTCLEP